MLGRRLPDGTDWNSSWIPGDYSKINDRFWIVCTPNNEVGTIDTQAPYGWKVTEHEDRTITVSPSILIHPHSFNDDGVLKNSPGWHGFLEQGVWRSC